MSTGAPARYVMQRGSPFRAPGACNDAVISCIRKKLLRKGTEKQTEGRNSVKKFLPSVVALAQ